MKYVFFSGGGFFWMCVPTCYIYIYIYIYAFRMCVVVRVRQRRERGSECSLLTRCSLQWSKQFNVTSLIAHPVITSIGLAWVRKCVRERRCRECVGRQMVAETIATSKKCVPNFKTFPKNIFCTYIYTICWGAEFAEQKKKRGSR